MFHVASQAIPRKAEHGDTIEEKGNNYETPLLRHFNLQDNSVSFVTIIVRILSGDTEIEYNLKFGPGKLLARDVCKSIAARQGLSKDSEKLFALWIMGRDLELQVKPTTNLFQLVLNWNKIVVKYTHFPQAMDPQHFVNRYWFVYRREASVSKEEESKVREDPAIRLLYSEAKRNVLSGRYPCDVQDAINLAALQLQSTVGNFDPLQRPPGYISMHKDFLVNIVPTRSILLKSLAFWEKAITVEHKRLLNVTPHVARMAYLNYVRQWRCYGCSFFPVTHDAPPAGFFEFRIQRWIAGVGPDGIIVFEKDAKPKYHFIEVWERLKWIHTDDCFVLFPSTSMAHLHPFSTRNHRGYMLITPQAALMHSLAARLAHLNRYGRLQPPIPIDPMSSMAKILNSQTTGSVHLKAVSSGDQEQQDRKPASASNKGKEPATFKPVSILKTSSFLKSSDGWVNLDAKNGESSRAAAGVSGGVANTNHSGSNVENREKFAATPKVVGGVAGTRHDAGEASSGFGGQQDQRVKDKQQQGATNFNRNSVIILEQGVVPPRDLVSEAKKPSMSQTSLQRRASLQQQHQQQATGSVTIFTASPQPQLQETVHAPLSSNSKHQSVQSVKSSISAQSKQQALSASVSREKLSSPSIHSIKHLPLTPPPAVLPSPPPVPPPPPRQSTKSETAAAPAVTQPQPQPTSSAPAIESNLLAAAPQPEQQQRQLQQPQAAKQPRTRQTSATSSIHSHWESAIEAATVQLQQLLATGANLLSTDVTPTTSTTATTEQETPEAAAGGASTPLARNLSAWMAATPTGRRVVQPLTSIVAATTSRSRGASASRGGPRSRSGSMGGASPGLKVVDVVLGDADDDDEILAEKRQNLHVGVTGGGWSRVGGRSRSGTVTRATPQNVSVAPQVLPEEAVMLELANLDQIVQQGLQSANISQTE